EKSCFVSQKNISTNLREAASDIEEEWKKEVDIQEVTTDVREEREKEFDMERFNKQKVATNIQDDQLYESELSNKR
ncbi:15525_t:CDS:1, partial [Racocetra persica]